MSENTLGVAFDFVWAAYLADLAGQANPATWPGWTVWLLLSLLAFAAERRWPWRPRPAGFGPEMRLDWVYGLFNVVGLPLLGFGAVTLGVGQLLPSPSRPPVDLTALPAWVRVMLLFVVRDFLHYWLHRASHASSVLWRIHQVHHSVTEMGFAAHLRLHWLEIALYRLAELLLLTHLGVKGGDVVIVFVLSFAFGHFNHANVPTSLGPLRYLFNSPRMHLWHHARALTDRPRNFGLCLSLWDWLFGTAHAPAEDCDVELGFVGIERYPRGFWEQLRAPFHRQHRE